MEPRFRRAQPGMPLSGRGLPGMPLEMEDSDGDAPRFGGARRELPQNPWWRPAGTLSRVLLGAGTLAILCSLAFAIHSIKTYLERDSRFRITGSNDIQATGLTEVTRAQMLPVFGEDIGRNIFFVPIAERRRELEQIPWIEKATVLRLLPDQIRVTIVERQPVAFVRHGQQIGLVDANGVLLDMPAAMMAQHHYSFPVVTGIDAGDPLAARKARMAVYQRLLADLDANGQHYSDQISEIDLTDPEDARVLMPEQGTDILAHFGQDHFLERYQRYKEHIAEWRQQYPKLAEVDLRFDQQVVLEMTHGTADAQASLKVPDEAEADSEPAKPSPDGKAAPKAQGADAPMKRVVADEAPKPANHIKSKPAATDHHATIKTSAKTPGKAHTSAIDKAMPRARAEKRLKEKKRAEAKRAALKHNKKAAAKRVSAHQGQ
ncbi:MAG TPA: FtsQ-type POTRA domain-containing protein [Terracidiphilus sp.]|nr:FtsQ-type POTRA domain-containing protein [Terracidiphilus sp.]